MSSYNSHNVNTSLPIAHLLDQNCTTSIWSCTKKQFFHFWWASCSYNCVLSLHKSFSVNMTQLDTFLSLLLSITEKKSFAYYTMQFKKKKKSYFVSPMFTVFVGAAAHMLCTPNARVDQGTRPGQQAAHKWVMTVTLTFGGRAGFGGARECRRSLCLIKQKLINVWFLLASFFEQHIAELICRVSESESDGATGAERRKTVCTGGVWKRLSRQYLIFSLNPKWETPGGQSSLINSSWICAQI